VIRFLEVKPQGGGGDRAYGSDPVGLQKEGRREKGEGRMEKGKGRREKGEGKRGKGKRMKEEGGGNGQFGDQ